MARNDPAWDLWRTFEAVIRTGSLSAAARMLGLAQPTVGRHIDELQTVIGTGALFIRSPRGLQPTPLALALQPQVEGMAAAARALAREASALPDQIAGSVRISASEIIGAEVLPPVLARLHREHPGLVLELVLTDASSDLLRRDADLAVRMTVPRQQALLSKPVGQIALGLFAHRDYLARRGTPSRMEQLADHAVIGYDRDTASLRLMGMALGIAPRFAARTDSTLAQLSLVRGGFGVGVVQDAIAARDPALVRVLRERFAIQLPTWIVMHEDLRATRRMRVVFDALVRGLGAHAGAGRP